MPTPVLFLRVFRSFVWLDAPHNKPYQCSRCDGYTMVPYPFNHEQLSLAPTHRVA